jgi:hypothetical protein|tara:strand:+ start:1501 stop:2352 length:852 start_codon:yes stop_codon:yes gene_type:complete
MENKLLKFDNNRRKAKVCPCGKSNKDGKFSPYLDFINKGYCHSCGNTYLPETDYKFEPYTPPAEIEVDLINRRHLEKSLSNYENNNFTLFLENTFGTPRTEDMISKYYIGTYGGKTIFWQIDEYFNIRTGKIMQYNQETGKRNGIPSWAHNKIKQDYKTCLFGLHLINQNSDPIAIVESEKTAIIMSYCRSDYNWLATGGISNISNAKLDVLKGRNITLYPDHDAYDQWKIKADKTGLKYKISPDCEGWYKEGKIGFKEDIADYYLKNHKFKEDLDWTEVQNR